MVDRALGPYAPSEVLADAFRLQITRRDMATLSGLNWLNDEVLTDHSSGQVTHHRSLTTVADSSSLCISCINDYKSKNFIVIPRELSCALDMLKNLYFFSKTEVTCSHILHKHICG